MNKILAVREQYPHLSIKENQIMKSKDKTGKKHPPLPNQAVSAYKEGADPLGSYTGITEEMVLPGKSMPRRDVGGKIYMKVDDMPIQDADDL